MMGQKKPYRVLIVDDSAVVRQALSGILGSSDCLEVMGVASDPFQAADRMRKEVPDVITLDIEMPRMDGISFLRRLMAQRPVPVVICSSRVTNGSDMLNAALEAGAVDVILKPRLDVKSALEEAKVRICDTVLAAAVAGPPRVRLASEKITSPKHQAGGKLTADAILPRASGRMPLGGAAEKVIAVGASTGGTEALRILLEALPPNCPPIVIVQHMPEGFTAAFAHRLNALCAISVKEASDGDRCIPGQAIIAPGNRHMMLTRSGRHYGVSVRDGPLVSRHRPSVDVLFRSVAQAAGANAIGVIMTGMGDDGAAGMLEMRQAGAHTIGQNEASCVIYGMPQVAKKLGAVVEEHDLSHLADAIMASLHRGRHPHRQAKGA